MQIQSNLFREWLSIVKETQQKRRYLKPKNSYSFVVKKFYLIEICRQN